MNKSSRSAAHAAIVKEVRRIYSWLDGQLGPNRCLQCGKCCDLAGYGLRLFISSPEWIYHRVKNLSDPTISRPGLCPYNQSGLCTIYQYRFAGCRIFQCEADQDTQSRLSESTLAMLKALCQHYQIEYRYMDLFDALSGGLSDIYP